MVIGQIIRNQIVHLVAGFLGLMSDWFLDPDELMMAASKNQRSQDYGEGDFRLGLKKFCQAVNDDVYMHPLARFIVRRITRLRLEDRLRIEKYVQKYPAILNQSVTSPILITGQPRSGTTFLQRLLATDSQFRVTRTWELYDPVPAPDPQRPKDPRIRRMEWDLRLLRWLAPGMQEAHPLKADDPEECYLLLERVFNQPVSCIFLDLPKYQEWLLNRKHQDLVSDYRYYLKQLQILQWKDENPRWLLKAPVHALYLEALVEVFPDIRIIIADRDPMEAIPSLCSLSARMRSGFYRNDDLCRLGNRLLNLMVDGRKRLELARTSIDEKHFFFYDYAELIDNPLEVIQQVYQFVGAEFTSPVENQMTDFLETSRKGIHNRHRYELNDYGLTPERIFEAFSDLDVRF